MRTFAHRLVISTRKSLRTFVQTALFAAPLLAIGAPSTDTFVPLSYSTIGGIEAAFVVYKSSPELSSHRNVKWERAKTLCYQLDFKGGGGWRLPTKDEAAKFPIPNPAGLVPPEPSDNYYKGNWNPYTNNLWIAGSFPRSILLPGQGLVEKDGTYVDTVCVRTGGPVAPGVGSPKSETTYIQKSGLEATILSEGKPYEWNVAKAACAALDFKGGGGWRLPNRNEVLKVSVYDNKDLLPESYRSWGVCDISVWTSESDPNKQNAGLWYCRGGNGIDKFESYKDRNMTVCVREGKPSAPVVVEAKKPAAASKPSTPITLSLVPEYKRDKAATEELDRVQRDYVKTKADEERRVAKEQAEIQAKALASEIQRRQDCMKPESRNACSCRKYLGISGGGACGK